MSLNIIYIIKVIKLSFSLEIVLLLVFNDIKFSKYESHMGLLQYKQGVYVYDTTDNCSQMTSLVVNWTFEH